ncbi:hypothetical protein [Streptosporangium sp. NPDC049644]
MAGPRAPVVSRGGAALAVVRFHAKTVKVLFGTLKKCVRSTSP